MTRSWIGIDISKHKFDVSVLYAENKRQHKIFANDPKGFDNFMLWLKYLEVTDFHFCMESTGIYGEKLAYYLYKSEYKVSIVNPARIKAYTRSESIRNKLIAA
jgi:transposase